MGALHTVSRGPLERATLVGGPNGKGARVLQELEEREALRVQHEKIRKPRLSSFRYDLEIDSPTFEPDLNMICRGFLDWSLYKEYLVFKKQHKYTYEIKFKAVLSAKRGNEVYAWRQRQRFKELQNIPDYEFFNYRDRSRRHKTRALFITLEFNPHETTIAEAWTSVGEHWNRFLTGLREKYGDVKALRVWEAHKSGYPHVHAILLFSGWEFEVFHHNDKWRASKKYEICSAWEHGFSDVEALASTRGGIRYVTKYLNKLNVSGLEGAPWEGSDYDESSMARLVSDVNVLTLALMWIFRKRAYGISRDFIDVIDDLHNSKSAPVQVDLVDMEPVWEFTLMGFWGGNLEKWSLEIGFRHYRMLKSSPTWSENTRLRQF